MPAPALPALPGLLAALAVGGMPVTAAAVDGGSAAPAGTTPSGATGPTGPTGPTGTVPAFTAAVAVDRTTRRTLRSHGVRIRVRCSAACSADLVLRVDPVSAKRLGLRSTRLATARLSRTSAGRTTVRPRLGPAVARVLPRAPRARLTVHAVVRGHAGGKVTVTRAVRLSGR